MIENFLYLVFLLPCRLLKCCTGKKEDVEKYVNKMIFMFAKVQVYDSIGLLGSLCTLAILVNMFYLKMVFAIADEESIFGRFFNMIHKYTGIVVDYSDIAFSSFWLLRVILLIIERVYNAYQYSCHRVNWRYFLPDATKDKLWRILFCSGRKIDYEKVLEKNKDPKKNQFLVNEFERQIRTQKNFNVFLMRLFNINEVWRDFRMTAYWRTYRDIGFNMHKTLLCFVASLSLAWIVNWWEENQTTLRRLQKARCDELEFVCLENIGRDECVCAQITQRSIISLVTVVLVGIAGFYVTYGELMKIIFRNWLRLSVKDAIWFVDSLGHVKDNEDQKQGKDKVDNTEDFEEEYNVDKTRGFTLDRKAILDDVFLIAFNNKDLKDEFTGFVDFVNRLAKEVGHQFTMKNDYLEKMLKVDLQEMGVGEELCAEKEKFTFNKMKDLITRYLLTRSPSDKIYLVDLTRRIRNILMKGTTMFTLVPKKDQYLLLMAKGRWSGGAFLPGADELKGISHMAIQHNDISFSYDDDEVMIVTSHRFRLDHNKEKCKNYHMSRDRSETVTMKMDSLSSNADDMESKDDGASNRSCTSVNIVNSVNLCPKMVN